MAKYKDIVSNYSKQIDWAKNNWFKLSVIALLLWLSIGVLLLNKRINRVERAVWYAVGDVEDSVDDLKKAVERLDR